MTKELVGLHCFDHLVLGHGTSTDEYDMNVNFTLAAGRDLDAARHFRDRLYTALRLKHPVWRKRSNEGRRAGSRLRALLVNSGTHHTVVPWAVEAKLEAGKFGVDVTLVDWIDSHEPPGPSRLRVHLHLLSSIDIYISGPGTSIMYQQLLPDGCVVINLGTRDAGPLNSRGPNETDFMDEFMSEGAPHLRVLYARLPPESDPLAVGRKVAQLAWKARRFIINGFGIPTPVGINLSPTTTLAKAYAHLKLTDNGTGLDPFTPWYETPERCMVLRSPPTFTHHVDPQRTKPSELPCAAEHPCLLAALVEDYNRWAPGLAWFHEGWSDVWLSLNLTHMIER